MTTDAILVTCTHPEEGADALAEALVTARLAACVQALRGVRSHYRWQGRVESAEEVRLDIKTTADRLAALVAEIRHRHPYEVPEIIAVPITGGHGEYLDWVREQTRPA